MKRNSTQAEITTDALGRRSARHLFNVQPVGKGRPRSAWKPGSKPIHYTPAKTKAFENQIEFFAIQAGLNNLDLSGPLHANVAFYFKRPKSRQKKGERYVTTKPDLDNLEKALFDALQKVNLFKDDKYIVECHSVKYYTDEEPYILLTIGELEERTTGK